MNYKLGQACITNWGIFLLLQIKANVVTYRYGGLTYPYYGGIIKV